MNLLGISWGMGARDVGMKAAMLGAQSNLDTMNKALEAQSKAAGKSKMPGLWDRMKESVKGFNIASIASDIHALTGDTGNLSNSLESMAVANAKAARPFVAAMNLSGKEARRMTGRISGMAIAMNVGAESVAKVFTEFNRMTEPTKAAVKALGMSEREFVKLTEGTGLAMEDMNSVMSDLTGSWNMSGESVATFLNTMTELGRKTGMGTAPLKGMKDQLQGLDDIFETLPPGMQRTGDEVTKLMESSVRLAGAFAAQGASQEQAAQMGADTAKMFAGQAVEIQRGMELGLSNQDLGEASPILKYLTGLGMTFDEAVQVIDTGSRDAVAGMQRVQQAFAASGKSDVQQQAMLAELSRTMGDSVKGLGWLAQGGDAAAASIGKMAAITVTGKDALRKLGDSSYSSGRTLQESYDLAKESFDTQIRSITRADVVGLVREKMGAFREVGKEMKDLAAKGGPLGTVIQGFSIFKQMGIQGVMLKIGKSMGMDTKAAQKMSIKFGMGFDAVKGMAEELTPVMNILGQFGPAGLAAGGIAGFFLLGPENRKKIMDTIRPLWEQVKKGLSEFWYGTEGQQGLSDYLSQAWDTAWPTIKQWGGKIWKEVVTAAQTYGPSILQALWSGIRGLGSLLMQGVGAAFADPKIGIAATLLVAFKAGGIFGPTGGLATLAVGAWVAAYKASEAALNELKAKNEAEKKIKEDADKKSADQAVQRLLAPSPMESEYFGADQAHAIVQKRTGKTIDYAQRYAADTETQLQMVERRGINTRSAFDQAIPFGLGSVAEAMVEAAQRQDVKKRTAKEKGIKDIKDITLLEGFSSMFMPSTVIEAGRKNVSSDIQNISTMQQTEKGQAYLEKFSAMPTIYAQQIENLPAVMNRVVAAQQQMTAAQQQVFGAVQQTVTDTQAFMDAATATMAVSALNGGAAVVTQFGAGVGSSQAMQDAVTAQMLAAQKKLGGSLPEEGPLGGTDRQNPAYFGGMSVMGQFAAGIDDGAATVTESMNLMLKESVLGTIDAYQVEMQAAMAKKGLLGQVASMLMQEFGSTVESTVTVDAKTEDVRATMKAMLNVPGLAGVTMAIINESAKQRAILDKIRIATELSATAVQTSKEGGGRLMTLPT